MLRVLALSLCLATPAFVTPALADFPETLRDHILPGYAAFVTATADLAATTDQTCEVAAIKPAFNAAFDAWLGVQHLRFGPVEKDGIGLAIQYWPDPKGSGTKAQRALLMGDPTALTPENFADQSVAARGLSGLERLLYPAEPLPAEPCPLIRATARDLARIAVLVNDAWVTNYGQVLLTAGEAGNTTFLTRPEARQMLFTQVIMGLEFIEGQRLSRSLGTFDKPRPERAESAASGRSLRNVLLSLQAIRALVESLTPDVPKTFAAFDHVIGLAEALDDPIFAHVAQPDGRLKVEILQQEVIALRNTALGELGPELDVGIGFNAADGD